LAAISAVGVSSTQAVAVFADDFSEDPGTAINGKASDIGSGWTTSAGDPTISATNTFDTSGAARTAFGSFSSILGSGQTLILTYDTLAVGGGNFFSGGYAGVSLYADGSERIFTGDRGGTDTGWGVDGGALNGGEVSSNDTTSDTSAIFIYEFDSGEWSFTTASGVDFSGTGFAGEEFDSLRVVNGNGGDIQVDNMQVNFIPEPSSALYRRRS
jgi:hypothetical protein